MQVAATRKILPENTGHSAEKIGHECQAPCHCSADVGIDDLLVVLQNLKLTILTVDRGGFIRRITGLELLPCSELSDLQTGFHLYHSLPPTVQNPLAAAFQACVATTRPQQCRIQLISPDNSIGRQFFTFQMVMFADEIIISIVDRTAEVAHHTLLSVRKNAQRELASLTAKEREILQLIAEGFSNKAMAWKHGVSIKTVEKHRSRMMKKLNAGSVADAVRVWLQADGNRVPASQVEATSHGSR